MKKITKKAVNQSVKDIEKEIEKIKHEIAKDRLNAKINPPKDVNSLFKKRKTLAVYLTVLSQKKELERLEKGK